MGASMMIVTATAPHFAGNCGIPERSEERQSILEQISSTRVQSIPAEKIIAALSVYEIDFAGNEAVIDGLNGDPEVEVSDAMVSAAREGLARFNPFQNRTVSMLSICDRDYFATGGLSYGDLPADTFDAVLLLDEVDLWGEPVTASEVAAALATLADAKR